MNCPRCQSSKTHKNGKELSGKQKYFCNECKYNFTEDSVSLSPVPKTKIGMSLDEFRDKHDVEHIVAKTLKKLDKNLIYEKGDLIKLSGLSYGTQGLSAILESQSAYYGKIGGRVYFSHPDTIKTLKEQAKLN